jgi:hypothetical protein
MDVVLAEAAAVERIERERDTVSLALVRRLVKHTADFFTWNEVQDYRANSTAIEALGALAKAKRVPFLSAHALENSATLLQVVNAAENRLWNTIRYLATYEARAQKYMTAVRDATTAQGKLDAAEGINWTVE